MEYHGRLYGKVGNKYFYTGKTSDEFDRFQKLAIEFQLEKEKQNELSQDEIKEWESLGRKPAE